MVLKKSKPQDEAFDLISHSKASYTAVRNFSLAQSTENAKGNSGPGKVYNSYNQSSNFHLKI